MEFAPNASVDKLIPYSSEDILYVEVKTEGIFIYLFQQQNRENMSCTQKRYIMLP